MEITLKQHAQKIRRVAKMHLRNIAKTEAILNHTYADCHARTYLGEAARCTCKNVDMGYKIVHSYAWCTDAISEVTAA